MASQAHHTFPDYDIPTLIEGTPEGPGVEPHSKTAICMSANSLNLSFVVGVT